MLGYAQPMRVPGFLARQFIVPGSLRNTPAGFSVQARNPLGDGMLVGILRIAVDGEDVEQSAITATRRGEETVYRADEVSRCAPVAFWKGDEVTFQVAGNTLAAGEHRLEVELIERDLGAVSVALTEPLAGDGPPAGGAAD
jgi:hypothetical protein